MPLDKLMAALRRSAGRPDRRCTGISLLTWHDLGWSPLPIVTFDARPAAWVSVMILIPQRFAIRQGVMKRPFVNVGNARLPGDLCPASLPKARQGRGLSLPRPPCAGTWSPSQTRSASLRVRHQIS